MRQVTTVRLAAVLFIVALLPAAAASESPQAGVGGKADKPAAEVPKATKAADNGDTTVYLTKTGAKYHRSGCASLRKSSIATKLRDAAGRGYAPCGNCRPPVLASASVGAAPAISQPRSSSPSRVTNSGRCQAITKKGTQCSRRAQAGSLYCWQHQR